MMNVINFCAKGMKTMSKYLVELSEEDLQMIKDCHSKNPSIMKAMNNAKKED
jgi:hypothetical protein